MKNSKLDIAPNFRAAIDLSSLRKYLHLVTGGIAGGVSRTATSPVERVKVLRQCGTAQYAQIPMQNIFQTIWRKEGVVGFFRGNGANLARIVPFSAIEFFSYDRYKAFFIGKESGTLQLLFCGSLAGTTASTLTYPLDLARTKLTIVTEGRSPSMMGTMTSTFQKEGILGLYKGWGVTVAGLAPYVGIRFMCFDLLKLQFPERTSFFTMILGAIAGTAAVTATYPSDLLKRKMQIHSAETPYRGLWGCVKHIAKTEGAVGFYKGLLPCYLKAVPSSAIAFMTNEKLKSILKL